MGSIVCLICKYTIFLNNNPYWRAPKGSFGHDVTFVNEKKKKKPVDQTSSFHIGNLSKKRFLFLGSCLQGIEKLT